MSQSISWKGYCSGLLRQFDYSAYLGGFFIDAQYKDLWLVVKTFAVEVALRRSSKNQEDMSAVMGRVAFWKDNLRDTNLLKGTKHPLLDGLTWCLNRYPNMEKYFLQRILDARLADAQRQAYYNLEEVEEYAEGIHSSAMYCILHAMGIDTTDTDHIASHLGKAFGLVKYIKAAEKNPSILPQDLLHKHSLNQHRLSSDTTSIEDLLEEIAVPCHQHFEESKRLWSNLQSKPRLAKQVFSPSAIEVDSYLRHSNPGWLPFNILKASILKSSSALL